jgi:hypothetical protein
MYRRNIDIPFCDRLSPSGFHEETIHTYQIHKNGYKVLIVPESITEHRQGSKGGYHDSEQARLADHQHDSKILTEILGTDKAPVNTNPDPKTQTVVVNEFFGDAICISLQRRPERRAEFLKAIKSADWPFVEPVFFDAIDANDVGFIPPGWEHPGQFGCAMSHKKVLHYAVEQQAKSRRPVLIMEDDVIFQEGFKEKIEKFLKEVPDNWEALMIGGRHPHAPLPVKPGIGRCQFTIETECYCVRGQFLLDVFNLVSNPDNRTPIDLILANIIRNYNAYCPIPSLAGQRANPSDIDGKVHPKTRW